MLDLVSAIEQDRTAMLEAVDGCREKGRALAQAEADYQAVKYSVALEMRASGESATMIAQILKGEPRVNRALFARDCAQADYDSSREEVNAYKLSARLNEAQLSREWASGERM